MCRQEMKICLDNFIKVGEEVISTEGLIEEWHGVRRLGINCSEILTKLIHEAANCKHFASDLFIDWQELLARLHKNCGQENFSYLFAFRENGVDSAKSTLIKANAGYCMKEEYNSIYRLDVSIGEKNQYNDQDVKMNLYKVQLTMGSVS